MAAEESLYVRTVLSSKDSGKAVDSSLALPSEDRSPRGVSRSVSERRGRVEQQVQLTLSRKGKRTPLTGSLSSSHLTSTTPFWNGSVKDYIAHPYCSSSYASDSFKPTRRVDVSDSVKVPQVNGDYAALKYGSFRRGSRWGSAAFTLPAMRSVYTADRLQGPASSHHYARSEKLQSTQRFISGRSATLHLPRKPVVEHDMLDDVFLPEGSPLRLEHHQIFSEWQNLQRSRSHPGQQLFGSQDLSWLVCDAQERQKMATEHRSQTTSKFNAGGNTNGVATVKKPVTSQIARVESMGGKKSTEMTLKAAVQSLTQENTERQVTAAKYIQNQCFSSAAAKRNLLRLGGIPKLLELLSCESVELQEAAAGALRNTVFDDSDNKMEVHKSNGIHMILHLLKASREVEIRRQVTGLLWNLSSHDMLKEQLCKDVVKPITDGVLVPCSGVSEGEDPKLEMLADSEVFLNATGCLRNVSSAGPNGRKAMRDCDRLIDSLVYYIRGTIADHKPDDKALENCVCILHNLTYRFESELPEALRPVLQESGQSLPLEPHTPGCFSIKSTKIAETDNHTDSDLLLLEEQGNPIGAEWLWSAITVRMYLSLVAISKRQLTLEASLGAMQNLTAGTAGVSQAVAHIIVQKENGLQQVKTILEEEEKVRRVALCLLRNLSRFKELHTDIIKQVLPELVDILPTSDTTSEQPVEITSVCHILNNLSQASVQNADAVFNKGVLPRIIKINTKDHRNNNRPTSVGQASANLLQTLWKHSELHGKYKKAGYRKADFINNKTAKTVNSARD
ncbi:plakophilin-2 isoform X2 [Hoplias malabaricus]|uniref:plakophilin-2 isoform X2 n=1 Tax=Hoplias malabaricus TaxID=27720 RepID=UPI0034622D94